MMEMSDTIVWRHEYKYLCDVMQNEILRSRAENLLIPDEHIEEDGTYRIRSLYFDNPYNQCYLDIENGIEERAKFRIRIYNEDASYIMLEKKYKKRGMTRKETGKLTQKQCRQLMAGEVPEMEADMDAALKLLLAEIQYRAMRPAVIVEYERTPFVEENGNVRITFDRNISSSQDFDSFLEKNITVRPILNAGMGIMEVKWDAYLPEYIRQHMELDTVPRITFSKYYLCRKYNCHGGNLKNL